MADAALLVVTDPNGAGTGDAVFEAWYSEHNLSPAPGGQEFFTEVGILTLTGAIKTLTDNKKLRITYTFEYLEEEEKGEAPNTRGFQLRSCSSKKEPERWLVSAPHHTPYILRAEHKESRGTGAAQRTLLTRILQCQAHGVHVYPIVEHKHGPALEEYFAVTTTFEK